MLGLSNSKRRKFDQNLERDARVERLERDARVERCLERDAE